MNPKALIATITLCALFIVAPFGEAQETINELRGQITDERGAVIAGAVINLVMADGTQRTTRSDAQGNYLVRSLRAGTWTLRIAAPGFATFELTELVIGPGQKNIRDVQLKIGLVNEVVTVPAENSIGTEPQSNADALVLKGDQLDILPEDKDDLASALQALAGPSAGPSGGEIFVDGFSGARLPSKSSIREVRVNQNPFSAEFDRIGFGRIEILTKPGTDKFAGEALFNFNDESLNARNPYTSVRAPYQVRSLDFSLSGPIVKNKASFFFDLEYRGLDDNANINALVLDSSLKPVSFIQAAQIPRRSQERQPRFDWQINKNHTLIAVVELNPSHAQHSGIGGFTLPSRAYETRGYERQFRLTETAILNQTTVSETRLQVRTDRSEQNPETSGYALNVQDAFNGGGDQSGPSLNRRTFVALYNNTTLTQGAHVLRFGMRLRRASISDESRANFLGTYTFSGSDAVLLDANNQVVRDALGNPVADNITSLERYRRTLLFGGIGAPPRPAGITDEQLGLYPTQFSISSGNPLVKISQFDIAGFVQDQWQTRPNLTLNLGLRYEGQSNVSNNINFAPRIALAWSPANKTAPAKSVVRAGFGVFFERINESLTLQTARYNGINQQQYVVTDRNILKVFPSTPNVATLQGFALPQTFRKKADDLRSPYLMQSAISYDRQLPAGTTISISYINIRALHQMRSRNINAPLPGTLVEGNGAGGVRPFGNTGNRLLYESSGIFNQNQLIVTLDSRFDKRIYFHATYGLSSARSNTDGVGTFPASTYDLSTEYGRASIDARHRFTVEGTLTAPWGFRVAPFFIVSSGRPFNIIIGRDLNGDTLFTDRPSFATVSTAPNDLAVTRWGSFDLNPAAGVTLIPRNFAQGSMFMAANLRVSRTFDLTQLAMFRGGPRPAGSKGESRYKVGLSVQVQNLLNRVNNDLPVGNLSSPFFGFPTSTLGGYGEGNRSTAGNRRVTGQIRFEF